MRGGEEASIKEGNLGAPLPPALLCARFARALTLGMMRSFSQSSTCSSGLISTNLLLVKANLKKPVEES
jgi:hypothetical protein